MQTPVMTTTKQLKSDGETGETQTVSRQTGEANYIRSALDAGCPEDQVRRFVDLRYVATPKALIFHALAREADRDDGPREILGGGARGGGKSHMTFMQTVDDCMRVAGLKALFIRKIQKTATESMEDIVYRALQFTDYEFTPSNGTITFPNGSRIKIGGYGKPADIEKYIGVEYDLIVIEELSQIPFDRFQRLLGSLRTTRDDWRTRIYASTNPGGVGHKWILSRYVVPYRKKIFNSKHRFVPYTYRDNPFLKQEYIDYLESLEGQLGKAWRDGDWDAFEGMAFPTFQRSKHVVTPFVIPLSWPKWRSVDWGSTKPFVCLWWALNYDRMRLFIYREVYATNLTDWQQVKMIKALTPVTEEIYTTYCDPALFARNKSDRNRIYSTADVYEENGILLTAGFNRRLEGKRALERVLADNMDGLPGLQIFSHCTNLIEELPTLALRETGQLEDVAPGQEDHGYDAVRYGLTNYMQHEIRDVDPYKDLDHKILETIL